MKRYLALAIIATAIAGCVPTAVTTQEKLKTEETGGVSTAVTTQQKLKTQEADVKALVQGNNEFAFDLYRRLSAKDGNIVFSPYSISTALAMTYAGARGETAAQMERVLRFTLGQERLHPPFGELMADLHKEDPGRAYHLHVANSLWGQKGYPFIEDFLQLTQKEYRAGLKELDFASDPEAARQIINRWVEEQTKEKIKELLLEGDVTSLTRLVLTNAIYFKGAWKIPFPKERTRDDVFAVTPTEKVPVAMMHHQGVFPYFEGDGFQWLELPYKGDRLSMVILLPKEKGQLANLEKSLMASALQKGIDQLRIRGGGDRPAPVPSDRALSSRGKTETDGNGTPFHARCRFLRNHPWWRWATNQRSFPQGVYRRR